MCELLKDTEHPSNLRIDHTLRTFNVRTAPDGTKTLPFMDPKIWSHVPSNTKKIRKPRKQNIRYWKPEAAYVGFAKTTLKDLQK